MIINKFKVPILERDCVVGPYFKENIEYIAILHSDFYEISIFNTNNDVLDMLKKKYIWISEEKSIESI